MKNKGNDGTGNIPERDLWQTDQKLWDLLNNQYHFLFDCCASKENRKCLEFSKNFEETIEIGNMAWMNPPFSNAYKMFEHFFKVVNHGVAIFRCDNMETKVWQEIILKNATWIFIPKGRVSYKAFDVGDMRKGMGTRFPSALIGLNVESPKGIDGITLFTKDIKNEPNHSPQTKPNNMRESVVGGAQRRQGQQDKTGDTHSIKEKIKHEVHKDYEK